MSHVFISYVRDDQSSIDRLCKELRNLGIDVWLDREEIGPGQRWKDAIRVAIEEGAHFLACFSQASITRARTYMNEELTIAVEQLRLRPQDRAWFIPVLLDDCELPRRDIGGGQSLHDLQWVSLARGWEKGIIRIAESVGGSQLERRRPDRNEFAAGAAVGAAAGIVAGAVLGEVVERAQEESEESLRIPKVGKGKRSASDEGPSIHVYRQTEHRLARVYVGNLPFRATDSDIRELFEAFGEVLSISLVVDKETGRPRGFGFVEMRVQAAHEAIAGLNGTVFGGRSLIVNLANPRGTSRTKPGR